MRKPEYKRKHWLNPEPKKVRDWQQSISAAAERLPDERRAELDRRSERVAMMSDEPGETAIYGVSANREVLDGMPTRMARAVWTFLNDGPGFRRAEEVRYTDEKRGGRIWDGFSGPVSAELLRDEAALENFKAALRAYFDSPNVHVELFDRFRPAFDGDDRAVVQLTIYREGRPDDVLAFIDGVLGTRVHKPVFEAAVTYESGTGAIEVVGGQRQTREDLAHAFSKELLRANFGKERLPLRRFDLQSLARRREFPTDPADGIEAVFVNLLRMMPLDTPGERLTIECLRSATNDIWAASERQFGAHDPLAGSWRITQAKLNIRFRPKQGSNRSHTLPVTITMPHGCDLKDRTERERLIGSRYLGRWGLVRDL